MDLKKCNILVTGSNGFLGRFIVQELKDNGVKEKKIYGFRSREFNLLKWQDALRVVKDMDVVIHAAALVGGIDYNRKNPGEILYKNIIMNTHIIEASRLAGVKKFVGIGSVCAYPKFTSIPFLEKNLWDGYPEETNAPYGLAKRMMLVQIQAYKKQYNFNGIYLLLTNLYGPGDSFDLQKSHVISALIKKIHEAKLNNQNFVKVWGSGRPTRDFLYVEDAAEAIILAAEKYNKPEPINVGSGREITIKELTKLICKIMNFDGKIIWDKTKPDGQPRRVLDIGLAKRELGFKPKTDFEEGLYKTIEWFYQKEN